MSKMDEIRAMMEVPEEPVTLKELFKKLKLSKKTWFIGLLETEAAIYPEYADELMETHGNRTVVRYIKATKSKTLVVELN